MKIAVEGCAHGELEKIYEAIQHLENQEGIKIDLLICCGDFQATRNKQDLRCMAVPFKYQKMCTFHKYYSGEKTAPVLTLFIGGNHEASNYLQELCYGGWVAPNIYYLGYAGVINIAGIRIAGLSGIYKGHDYMKGHYEKPPYSEEAKRSVYHVRNLEVFRLKQLKEPLDIMISHDWPRGVYNHGNLKQLIQSKPFFRDDIKNDKLGSKPCEELLEELKPKYWFAAHLHVKFAALVAHKQDENEKKTKFLALDKCLPKRKFLQILDIPHDANKPLELQYDLEWLTVLHLTNHLLSVKSTRQYMPGPCNTERWIFTPTHQECTHILNRFGGDLKVPLNFVQTAKPHMQTDSSYNSPQITSQPEAQINPQTSAFCDKLGVDDPIALLLRDTSSSNNTLSQELPHSFHSVDQSGDVSQVSFITDEESAVSLSQQDIFSIKSDVTCSNTESPKSIKRLSLLLPAPKGGDKSSELVKSGVTDWQDEDNSLLNKQEKIKSETHTATLTGGDVVHINEHLVTSEILPAVKKFKRRNQALYTDMEES